jgi:NADH-quinone oxidoreductase subunit C
VRFDDERYSVIYEPLEMTQEFRTFNFKSPWEKYIV